MAIAIIITAIIQLITLIVFFVMATNLALIKKTLLETESPIAKYMRMANEEIYIGNKERAKEYLLRAKYYCGIVYQTTNVYVGNNWMNRIEYLSTIDKKIAGL